MHDILGWKFLGGPKLAIIFFRRSNRNRFAWKCRGGMCDVFELDLLCILYTLIAVVIVFGLCVKKTMFL